MSVSKLILCFTATIASLSAQEAWLLEMPNKFGDYLIKKSVAGDYDTVAGIVEKIPGFVAKKQFKEIENITWNAEEGKIHKKGKVTEGTRTITTGARYYSLAGTKKTHRKLTIKTASTERNFEIDTFGFLPRAWTPTFAHRGEKITLVLLERHAESTSATVSSAHSRTLAVEAGKTKESFSWYSSDALANTNLAYSSQQGMAANPKVTYGAKIFTALNLDGNSLLRIEVNSRDANTEESIILHHNEANFKGVSQTTGPLKKEVVKIADRSFTNEGEEGTWTLTLTSGE